MDDKLLPGAAFDDLIASRQVGVNLARFASPVIRYHPRRRRRRRLLLLLLFRFLLLNMLVQFASWSHFTASLL